MKEKLPLVSIGIVVFKGDEILFGKTKNNEGRTSYILPVGHLEYMESFSDCAKRELLEECGIEITDIRFHFLANTRKYRPRHYVHVGLIARWKSEIPEVLESDTVEAWEWRSTNNLPKLLSIGATQTIKALVEKGSMYDM